MGRQLAGLGHDALGISADPRQWSDDEVALVLLHYGADLPGNLLLGERALRQWHQQRAMDTPSLAEHELAQAYPELAARALAEGSLGASAGGEFPKFTALGPQAAAEPGPGRCGTHWRENFGVAGAPDAAAGPETVWARHCGRHSPALVVWPPHRQRRHAHGQPQPAAAAWPGRRATAVAPGTQPRLLSRTLFHRASAAQFCDARRSIGRTGSPGEGCGRVRQRGRRKEDGPGTPGRIAGKGPGASQSERLVVEQRRR